MKKLLSLALVLTLVLSTFAMLTVSSSAEETTLVEKGSEWQVLTYDNSDATAPEGWQNGAGEGWEAMNAPICGEWYSGGHNHNGMEHTLVTGTHKTYMRKTFTVADASAYSSLLLNIIYDEDPTVYINGEQVFTATGYHDSSYVDSPVAPTVLKDGENTICVEFTNAPSGGGSMLDLALVANDSCINDDGSVIISGTACSPTIPYVGNNAPSNVLDGNTNTVCGYGWNPNEEMSVTLTFLAPVLLDKVTVDCKKEGDPAEGAWGTYEIFALNGETATSIGSVDAYPEGRSIELAEGVEATGVKVVITSWNGSAWACVADIMAYGSEIEEAPAPEGPAVIKIASWWNIGWENWKNSPNNPNGEGAEPGVTQMLVEISDADGAAIDIDPATTTWKVTISANGESKTIEMDPATRDVGNKLYRFETCMGEGDNQFVPVKDTDYTVQITVYGEDGAELYKSEATSGFVCKMEPVVPEEEPVDPPVDPIDPPQAGDATAIIAVLAIVALFGAAVVTKKAFVK